MKNIEDSIRYLSKSLTVKLKEMQNQIKSVKPNVYKGTEQYVMEYFLSNSDLIHKELDGKFNQEELVAFNHLQEIVQYKNDYIDVNKISIVSVINLIVIYFVILKLKTLSVFETKFIKDYNDLEKINKENLCWYRGQASIEWKLIPSFYRSLGSKTVIVDTNYLNKEYSRLKITSRVNSIINSTVINYEQLAFIQHSMSFSPLLDFSTDIYSAASFAVSNLSKPNLMHDESAALFSIKLNGESQIIKNYEDIDLIIKDINVEYIGSKPYVSTLIKSKMWNDLINEKIFSEYKLIDIKTNDRMRIQNGTFVLFNNVMIIGDDMIVSTKAGKALSNIITKYEIKADSGIRYNLYKEVMKKDTKYHLKSMLNPYDYMNF